MYFISLQKHNMIWYLTPFLKIAYKGSHKKKYNDLRKNAKLWNITSSKQKG